jgi:hypothetical protein
VRAWGFLVIHVRSNVSNVGIRQADNLARVTRVSENFLISSEAGIENYFAAAPSDRSRCAPMKNAPIFERKYSLPCFSFGQWTLFFRLRQSASGEAGYFTDSANTGIEPK